jgi:hypothetical protein
LSRSIGPHGWHDRTWSGDGFGRVNEILVRNELSEAVDGCGYGLSRDFVRLTGGMKSFIYDLGRRELRGMRYDGIYELENVIVRTNTQSFGGDILELSFPSALFTILDCLKSLNYKEHA